MAAILALLASLLWGSSDFGGGLLSRRLPVLVVVVTSQATALLVTIVAVFAAELSGNGVWSSGALAWGAVSGTAGMVGLVCFYTALASGAMGVVAPIASMGLAVPLVVGLARGDHPSGLQIAGIVAAVVGVVLVARVPGRRAATSLSRAGHHRAVALALGAAFGFGVALLALAEGGGGQADGRFGQVLAGLLAQRAVNVLIAVVVVLAIRHRLRGSAAATTRLRWQLMAVGVIDIGANASYGYASLHGTVSVVSVLASLYPVVTVLLARYVLGERLGRSQLAGVGVSLGGVILLGTG